MRSEIKRNLTIALGGALLFVALVHAGMFNRLDKWVQDKLYQQPKALSGDIVIIGIDEEALERIGEYNTWDRNVMAKALEALNSDPDNKPAVVGIDTLYSGQTDPDADAHLAKAAADLGNVVTATSAVMGTQYIDTDDGGMTIDTYAVLNYEEPYDDLKYAVDTGHINAMYDMDGIMRHSLLYIKPDGQEVYSMAYVLASKYLEAKGDTIIAPPVNKRGQFYVDYSAKPGGFYDEVSISDLIDGDVPADYYAGKIVLIGPYAAGLQDAYFTPIERAGQMYGVEFQANVITQMLNKDYKSEASNALQLIILFIICIAASLIFANIKIIWSSVTAVALIVISLIISVMAYARGKILHPLWIPIGIAVFYLIAIVIHYLQAALERREITRTFKRYVAPEIVQEILKEGTENLGLGGKTCDIAVLFVDVRGFTTMSENLAPEKVVAILNKYLTMASDAVEAHKGTLDKFVGDAMMAFWGAPLPQEDAVYNAILTAKDIVDGAARVSEELKEEMGQELRVGVGVHFGPAVVGNMGAEKHMDYTAIGDTVNTAARLEANAPGGEVYLSRVVCDMLEGRITYTSLGDTIKLKGKAEGFEVLRLDSVV
ncbi:MAG: adenylate/guanylate cyclase domain-containing protein [Lachnospiraceae bacterium]|nr:adenylate/guanylate cyclase domain-containing protein [Lachnospiraceae bacterium]